MRYIRDGLGKLIHGRVDHAYLWRVTVSNGNFIAFFDQIGDAF